MADGAARLAMMMRAKQVFEADGGFLSFPILAPLSYPLTALDFSRALTDRMTAAAQLDFSRAVSCRPGNPLFSDNGDPYLWERYSDWLDEIVVAGTPLTASQQAAYTAARSLLVATDAAGNETDSEIFLSYKQHSDAVNSAEQAYEAARSSATAAGTQALADWQATKEPALRSAVSVAQQAFVSDGHKLAVEGAQAIIDSYEKMIPEQIVQSWRRAYNPEIDNITDATSNVSYAPSNFSPADLGGDWTLLEIAGSDINSLAQSAPAELRRTLGGPGPTAAAKVSFECRSVSVVMDWFKPAMFDARFWRFPDRRLLSDGMQPPSGYWPAYVTGVVFIRNLQETTLPPSAGSENDGSLGVLAFICNYLPKTPNEDASLNWGASASILPAAPDGVMPPDPAPPVPAGTFGGPTAHPPLSFTVSDGGKFVRQPDGTWTELSPPGGSGVQFRFAEVYHTNSYLLLYDGSRNFFLRLPMPAGTATWKVGLNGATNAWMFVQQDP